MKIGVSSYSFHQAVEAESIWQGQSLGRALTDQLMKELKLP